jgi:hypothetical protein
MCFIVHKTTSELKYVILTTLYLAGVENTKSMSNQPIRKKLATILEFKIFWVDIANVGQKVIFSQCV